ncbi:MAG: XrtA/PEP-CTERM system histidine kinase PrsK [Rhodospirillaceae bacterium]
MTTLPVSLVSYLICAVAYALAAAVMTVGRSQDRYRFLLMAACTITAVWSSTVAAQALWREPPAFLPLIALVFEHLRSGVWIAVVALLLHFAYGRRIGRVFGAGLAAATFLAMAYSIAATALKISGINVPDIFLRGIYLAQVTVAVIGLLLVENLFRNSGRGARWSVKYLCFGVGVIFSYDFFVYAQGALLARIDYDTYAARGIVTAIAMPLVLLSAARSKNWPVDVHVSRSFVFHSATLLAAGVYLMVMAAAGFSLRIFDSPWGAISQVTFLVASLLVLAVILSSGEAQARFKTLITHHFFKLRYDYRLEWLRFIDAISGGAANVTIPERVAPALANIIGATGSAIWVRHDGAQTYRLMASSGMTDVPGEIPITEPWLDSLTACPGVVDLVRGDVDGNEMFRAKLPEWLLKHSQARSVLPLLHAQTLVGLVALGEMRAPRALDWEDFDILNTAARQAASYIAEDAVTQALAEARRFEDFNHRFAFIVHDVKNLAAQMTLILTNAERHGDNPEFQKEILKTIRGSVDRLRTMLEQLKGQSAAPAKTLDLTRLLQDLTDAWKLQFPTLTAALPIDPILIEGNADQLHAVVGHLLQNAADATGEDGSVRLDLRVEACGGENDAHGGIGHGNARSAPWALITVADDGPGMDQDFINRHLFEPLCSGKRTGFGIGAFQARQIARGMGGGLDVESTLGIGTRFTMRVPCASPPGDAIR